MESMSRAIDQQIILLKKSMKNKKRNQIWERAIHFYRNHLSSINNYQIIKIIKICLKSLKSMIFSQLRRVKRIDDNESDKNREFLINKRAKLAKNLLNNFTVLQRTLESYTIVLQTFLQATDPQFFSYVLSNELQTNNQDLQPIFQPKVDSDDPKIGIIEIQHQLRNYMNFFCRFQLIYLHITYRFISVAKFPQILKEVEQRIMNVSNLSHLLCFKKIEFQILKIAFLQRIKQHDQQFNTFPPHITYKFPLQALSIINAKRQKSTPTRDNLKQKLFRLLIRYAINIIANQKLISNKNLQTDFLVLCKEILTCKRKNNINLNIIDRRIMQFLKKIQMQYEKVEQEQAQILYFLRKYFNLFTIEKQIMEENIKMRRPKTKQSLCSQGVNDYIKKQQKSKNPALRLYPQQKGKKDRMEFKNIKNDQHIHQVLTKFQWSFNLIEESDSDEDGFLAHEFERQRRREILKQKQSNKLLPKLASTIIQQKNSQEGVIDFNLAVKKLNRISESLKQMSNISTAAIKTFKKQNQNQENSKRVRSLTKNDFVKIQVSKFEEAVKCKSRAKNISDLKNRPLKLTRKNTQKIKINTNKNSIQSISNKNQRKSPLLLEFRQKFGGMSRKILLSNTKAHIKQL